MGRNKSKQSLARRDLPSGGLHGGSGDQANHANGGEDISESESTTEETSAATAEAAARATTEEETGRLDTEEEMKQPKPRLKKYVPPDCSVCVALRPDPEASYVYVYHTERQGANICRYCKCGFCNNTFKDVEHLK